MIEEIIDYTNRHHVKLIAVSKTKPVEQIKDIYDLGLRAFGENKVQELIEKENVLPKNIEWHMIGHLQKNKVKYIASFIHLIHSVDSLDLLVEINKYAMKNNRIIDCLLQFYIANENTKFGLSVEEAKALLESDIYLKLSNVKIVGVMGMATFTDDLHQIRSEFRNLKSIFNHIKQDYFINNPEFNEISMGMSDDYKIAIEEGSTMVRIGSLLFGKRNNL